MNLLLYGFLALAILGAIGTGVYKVKQWGANEVRAEWKAANETARESERLKSFAAATGLQSDRDRARIIIQKRNVYVDKIVDRPVYRNVCLDADGLRCIASAINGTDAAGCKPDSAVPASKPSG